MLLAVPATIRIAAFHAGSIQIGHFELGYFLYLRLCDLADLLFVGLGRTAFYLERLFDEHRSGRRLGHKCKRPVRIYRQYDRYDKAGVFCRSFIKFLAEPHDVHAVLAQCGPTGGAGVALPAGN